MCKVSSIKRKLLNCFKPNITYNPLIVNEALENKKANSYITIKLHIYIPRYMQRVHHIVSLDPFI